MQPNYRNVDIPRIDMGTVSSDDLFEDREQALFDFYAENAGRYRNVLDVGANIGVHSILMARTGWNVTAFEPDLWHYAHLLLNLDRNGVKDKVRVLKAALSTQVGEADFVRVLGNTTASHLAGARNSHGETLIFRVHTLDCRDYFNQADFAKIDVEGHEAALLLTITHTMPCEFMVEIGSPANAQAIYDHCRTLGRRMWSQAIGWREVQSLSDVPLVYSQGSMFIGEEPPFEGGK